MHCSKLKERFWVKEKIRFSFVQYTKRMWRDYIQLSHATLMQYRMFLNYWRPNETMSVICSIHENPNETSFSQKNTISKENFTGTRWFKAERKVVSDFVRGWLNIKWTVNRSIKRQFSANLEPSIFKTCWQPKGYEQSTDICPPMEMVYGIKAT